MFLDLKSVFVTDNACLPIEYELDLSELDFSGEYPLKTPVKVSGKVENRAGVVSLRLTVKALYDAACDRCGEPAKSDLVINVDRVVVQSISGEDTGEYIIVPDAKLDLDETVMTEVVLGVPVKHLCREDCRGRCSNCGKNLNEGDCGCEKNTVDPRLAALAELLKD